MTQMAGDKLFELFDIALDTSSPYTIPSRGDLEKDDILNSPGYKHLLEKGLIPPPVKKADASDVFLDNKIITEGGGGRKGFLGLGGRYPKWTNEYDKDTGISTTTTEGFGTSVQGPSGLTQTPYGLLNRGEGTEIAPHLFRDQYWKMDLKGIEKGIEEEQIRRQKELMEETRRRIELNRMLSPRF
jgi:hypothetical protein